MRNKKLRSIDLLLRKNFLNSMFKKTDERKLDLSPKKAPKPKSLIYWPQYGGVWAINKKNAIRKWNKQKTDQSKSF